MFLYNKYIIQRNYFQKETRSQRNNSILGKNNLSLKLRAVMPYIAKSNSDSPVGYRTIKGGGLTTCRHWTQKALFKCFPWKGFPLPFQGKPRSKSFVTNVTYYLTQFQGQAAPYLPLLLGTLTVCKVVAFLLLNFELISKMSSSPANKRVLNCLSWQIPRNCYLLLLLLEEILGYMDQGSHPAGHLSHTP